MLETIQILQQIADNTADDKSAVWIAAISSGSVILGAIVSAAISYFITNRSIASQEKLEQTKLKVTIVTSERLRWLQDVRSRISNLYVNLDMQYNLIKRPVGSKTPEQIQVVLDEYSSKINSEINMIYLMLNNKDKIQIDLRRELHNVLIFMSDCFSQTTNLAQSFNDLDYGNMKNKIFECTTELGTETWDQISNLK